MFPKMFPKLFPKMFPRVRPAMAMPRTSRVMSKQPVTIADYIATFPPRVRAILKKIRGVVRAAAPDAAEVLSYRMPAFRQNGILVYFAAFQQHIGMFPPIRGDAALVKALSRYAGEKGNLRFPYAEPMPYELIERIVKLRVKQDAAKAAAKSSSRAGGTAPSRTGAKLTRRAATPRTSARARKPAGPSRRGKPA